MNGILIDRTSRSSLSEEEDVRCDEGKNCAGNEEDMCYIEAGQCERSDGVAAAQQAGEPVADPRYLAHDVSAHGGGEIGFLIPRQQVASETHAEHKAGKHSAGHPQQLAAAFERAVEKSLKEMKREHNNHRAGSVVVEAAQECSGSDLLGDIGNAGVRRLSGGNIVERETDAGDDLRDEDE